MSEETKYPYREYPGGIRQAQELDRLEKYLRTFGVEVAHPAPLPYNISHAINISERVYAMAIREMFAATDSATLKSNALMALRASQLLQSIASTTDDFLQAALNEVKTLQHSDTLPQGCLAPGQELPF